ncbi:hypothetical protein ES703_32297 [subsurface metagenome]
MIYSGSVIKLNTSHAIIIPKPIAESMKMYKGQIMIIKQKKKHVEIVSIDAYFDKRGKVNDY